MKSYFTPSVKTETKLKEKERGREVELEEQEKRWEKEEKRVGNKKLPKYVRSTTMFNKDNDWKYSY